MRFDRPGEALLAAYSEGVLAAIGGITIDPIVPDALRMRRFYVRPAFRRTGIGSEIAQALLERARSVPLVTLNAAVKSVPFWESLGFVPQARDGHTHIWHGAERKQRSPRSSSCKSACLPDSLHWKYRAPIQDDRG
jgi:GNAT superfamily N-acetyltransferase